MTGGVYATQGGQRGMANQIDLIFDGFEGAVALFTHESNSLSKSGYLSVIFNYFRALRGAPTVTDG